jgi:hypothetical protein
MSRRVDVGPALSPGVRDGPPARHLASFWCSPRRVSIASRVPEHAWPRIADREDTGGAIRPAPILD